MLTSLLSRLSDNHPWHNEDDYPWELSANDILLAELKMILTSRVRMINIEDLPLVNESIINYGIDESFSKIQEISKRLDVMEMRLKNVIARFEPRLTNVSITNNINQNAIVTFYLQASYLNSSFVLEMKWNDCTGRFYFNE
ncbi:hypothetical protein GJV07_22675 [Enterobacteriaceae bacterium RIT711]|nr:hypothetical protein [Enterobacteriaceae bacterium RIT711]